MRRLLDWRHFSWGEQFLQRIQLFKLNLLSINDTGSNVTGLTLELQSSGVQSFKMFCLDEFNVNYGTAQFLIVSPEVVSHNLKYNKKELFSILCIAAVFTKIKMSINR